MKQVLPVDSSPKQTTLNSGLDFESDGIFEVEEQETRTVISNVELDVDDQGEVPRAVFA